jgi:hypothetical protein
MSFLDHVLKHPDLPFATDDEENINNLKKANGKMSKSTPDKTDSAETRVLWRLVPRQANQQQARQRPVTIVSKYI